MSDERCKHCGWTGCECGALADALQAKLATMSEALKALGAALEGARERNKP